MCLRKKQKQILNNKIQKKNVTFKADFNIPDLQNYIFELC